MGNGQIEAAQLGDGTDQRRKVLVHGVDDQLSRQIAFGGAQVVLLKKRLQHFADTFLDSHLRKEILAPQHPAATHGDQVNAGAARADHRGDDIHVASAALHALLILHATQDADLIANLGGTLEIEVHRRLFHIA